MKELLELKESIQDMYDTVDNKINKMDFDDDDFNYTEGMRNAFTVCLDFVDVIIKNK